MLHEQQLTVERRVDDRALIRARAVRERSRHRRERVLDRGLGGGRRRCRQRHAGLVARDQRRELPREGGLAATTVADDGDELSGHVLHSRWRRSHELNTAAPEKEREM